jgi:hypothetical protein
MHAPDDSVFINTYCMTISNKFSEAVRDINGLYSSASNCRLVRLQMAHSSSYTVSQNRSITQPAEHRLDPALPSFAKLLTAPSNLRPAARYLAHLSTPLHTF